MNVFTGYSSGRCLRKLPQKPLQYLRLTTDVERRNRHIHAGNQSMMCSTKRSSRHFSTIFYCHIFFFYYIYWNILPESVQSCCVCVEGERETVSMEGERCMLCQSKHLRNMWLKLSRTAVFIIPSSPSNFLPSSPEDPHPATRRNRDAVISIPGWAVPIITTGWSWQKVCTAGIVPLHRHPIGIV